MKRILKRAVFTSLMIFTVYLFAFPQLPANIILDKQYYGSLDQVLNQISLEKKASFSFNKRRLSAINTDGNTINQPLAKLLDQWCGMNQLEWHYDSNEIISIVGKNKTPGTIAPKVEETDKKHTGKPKKFNILISGKVTDSETGEAIPYATIRVKGINRGSQTNQDGYYTLQNVPTDTSTIVISSIGYKNGILLLNPDMPKTNLNIAIEPMSFEVGEVIVSGQKENTFLNTSGKISTMQMTPKQLVELPNIGEKDILRVFQLMPGVSAANEGSSGLYVRGGTPDQNLILYDGFTVYHVDHLYGFYSAFNSNAVKDIQLYKGGFESKYAGRLSSVTDITGKDGNSKGFNVGGDISLLSANVYTEIPVGNKFTSLFAFRKSYKGPIYNKIFEQFNNSKQAVQRPSNGGPVFGPGGGLGGGRFGSNNFTSQVSSYFYDLNTKLSYRPTDNDIISFSLFNGTDNLDNSVKIDMPSFGGGGMGIGGRSFGSDNSDLTKYGNLGTSLKWSRRWTDKFYGNTLVSYSNYYNNRDRTSNQTITDKNGNETTVKTGALENNDVKDFSFHSDYNWDVSSQNQISFGLKLTKYIINYSYSQNDTSTILNMSDKGMLIGGYLQNKFKLLDNKLTIIPGIHTTYYEITGKVYAEPRISATYAANDKLKYIGAWGKYYQFANRITREDILSGSSDFWILSDDQKVPVSQAYHYITGVNYETTDYLFSVEGYYKQLVGISEYSLRFNPNPMRMGTRYEQNFYTGKGYTQGIEFLAQKKVGSLTGWVSYTRAQARYQFDVYGDKYFPANQDITNEFKIIGIYKWRKISFAATWIFATGRPYSAPEGGYAITLLDGSEKTFVAAGEKNSQRLPDYHRLDLAVNYLLKFRNDLNERGNISFSLFNVYNRENVWYKEYQIVDDQIISIDKLFLGITPNITITLKLK